MADAAYVRPRGTPAWRTFLGVDRSDFRWRVFLVAIVLMNFGLWLQYGGGHDFSSTAESGSGSPIATIFWGLCYLVAIVGLIRDRVRAFEVVRRCVPFVLLLALTIVSASWAEDPTISARRSVELVGACSLAFFIVLRLGLRGFVNTLAFALAISAALSVLLIAFVPSVGTGPDGLSGMFASKNGLGPAMLVGLISTLCAMEKTQGRSRMLKTGLISLYTLLLVASRNGAGLIGGIVLAVFAAAILRSRSMRSPKLVLGCVAVLGFVAFFASLSGFGVDDVLGLFGKDATFTGRTELWQAIGEAMQDHPLLGYGYNDFWGLDGPAARLVYPVVAWTPQSSHNGFIEVQLGMGLMGEALLLLSIGVIVWRSWSMFWRADDSLSAWPLLTILYVILSNFSGATFLGVGNSIDQMLMIAAYAFAVQASAVAVVPALAAKAARRTYLRPRQRVVPSR